MIENEISRYQFLRRIRRHGINPGKIRNQGSLISPDRAIFPVNRHPGEIAHMLIGTGQLVEQRRFSAVLISHQCKCQQRPLRQRIPASLRMKLPLLAESRMIHPFSVLLFHAGIVRLRLQLRYLNLVRIIQSKRQLIAMQPDLHRVTHRCKFCHRDRDTGNDSHVKEMLTQLSVPANFVHTCPLSRLYLF